MSINDFLNKIKGKLDIDRTTILCLIVVILVGLSSFGLGRLSVHENLRNDELKLEDNNTSIVKEVIGNSYTDKNKMFVASKNGKLYYGINCSGAKRISEENKLWFAREEDAMKAGYEPASSCK